jgi:hypothetical protein
MQVRTPCRTGRRRSTGRLRRHGRRSSSRSIGRACGATQEEGDAEFATRMEAEPVRVGFTSAPLRRSRVRNNPARSPQALWLLSCRLDRADRKSQGSIGLSDEAFFSSARGRRFMRRTAMNRDKRLSPHKSVDQTRWEKGIGGEVQSGDIAERMYSCGKNAWKCRENEKRECSRRGTDGGSRRQNGDSSFPGGSRRQNIDRSFPGERRRQNSDSTFPGESQRQNGDRFPGGSCKRDGARLLSEIGLRDALPAGVTALLRGRFQNGGAHLAVGPEFACQQLAADRTRQKVPL